jgi:RIMS-binding protein 2
MAPALYGHGFVHTWYGLMPASHAAAFAYGLHAMGMWQQPGMQQPGMQQPGMQQPDMQQPDMQQSGMLHQQ